LNNKPIVAPGQFYLACDSYNLINKYEMEVYESIVFVIGNYPDNKCVCFSPIVSDKSRTGRKYHWFSGD